MNLKGSSLIFSLVVLSFLLISALSVAVVSVTTQRSSLSSRNSNISFQVADSAAEVMLRIIYKINDAGITIANPNNLASNLGASCSATQISGAIGVGNYTAILYKNTGSASNPTFASISCNDNNWRSSVVKIRFLGTYRGMARAIDVGVKPKP